jgi:cob(I)alamin adenosyltransferase
MGELAALPENHAKLTEGQTRVTAAMVQAVEVMVDDLGARFEAPTDFVVPGQTPLAAQLDLARTVVRRAEREAVAATVEGSHVLAYLNRLSSLLWAQARWVEGEHLLSRDVPPGS